ncbi:MAG: CsbD family protein [Anaerolineae bacterium]|nr:CsbD family protein [Anaerolineae bacterium]
MDNIAFAGKWRQLRGKIQEEWGDLTDDELDQIEGRREQLVGLLQEKYGYARDEAEDRLDELLEDIDGDRR